MSPTQLSPASSAVYKIFGDSPVKHIQRKSILKTTGAATSGSGSSVSKTQCEKMTQRNTLENYHLGLNLESTSTKSSAQQNPISHEELYSDWLKMKSKRVKIVEKESVEGLLGKPIFDDGKQSEEYMKAVRVYEDCSTFCEEKKIKYPSALYETAKNYEHMKTIDKDHGYATWGTEPRDINKQDAFSFVEDTAITRILIKEKKTGEFVAGFKENYKPEPVYSAHGRKIAPMLMANAELLAERKSVLSFWNNGLYNGDELAYDPEDEEDEINKNSRIGPKERFLKAIDRTFSKTNGVYAIAEKVKEMEDDALNTAEVSDVVLTYGLAKLCMSDPVDLSDPGRLSELMLGNRPEREFADDYEGNRVFPKTESKSGVTPEMKEVVRKGPINVVLTAKRKAEEKKPRSKKIAKKNLADPSTELMGTCKIPGTVLNALIKNGLSKHSKAFSSTGKSMVSLLHEEMVEIFSLIAQETEYFKLLNVATTAKMTARKIQRVGSCASKMRLALESHLKSVIGIDEITLSPPKSNKQSEDMGSPTKKRKMSDGSAVGIFD